MIPFDLEAAKRGDPIGMRMIICNASGAKREGFKHVRFVGALSDGLIVIERAVAGVRRPVFDAHRESDLCMQSKLPRKMFIQFISVNGTVTCGVVRDTAEQARKDVLSIWGGRALRGDPQLIEVPDEGAGS